MDGCMGCHCGVCLLLFLFVSRGSDFNGEVSNAPSASTLQSFGGLVTIGNSLSGSVFISTASSMVGIGPNGNVLCWGHTAGCGFIPVGLRAKQSNSLYSNICFLLWDYSIQCFGGDPSSV